MVSNITFVIIILIGFISNISPQQTFRKMAYLNQSVGGHIYSEGITTNIPTALSGYNTEHSFTGDSICTITKVSAEDDYPPGGNQIWKWQKAFYDSAGYSFKEDILETSTYSVIMIKHCFASQSDIWWYWQEGPSDTINYPYTQSIYNYQWYTRKIARKMGQYPEKFFIWWNIPPMVPGENSNVADMQRLRWFNKWMVDTLQAGLDTLYGDFPDNIYIYDYFELVDSANFLPLSLADSWTDSHPNADCSELVAPDFVQKAFDAAIAYEAGIITGVREVDNDQMIDYDLEQNYPNPFNPSTKINFTLTQSGNITLIVYDIAGSEVDTLVEGYMNSGKHSVIFNAKDLDSGVYFYRLKTDSFTTTRKMLLIK